MEVLVYNWVSWLGKHLLIGSYSLTIASHFTDLASQPLISQI